MKSIILCVIIITFISAGLTKGQLSSDEVPGTLEKLYGRLLTNFDDNDRLRINDSIKLIIESYVASDTVFTHRFSNLRYLGQITSSDSLLKIITWNLVLSNNQGRYFCYLIRKSLHGEENIIYKLTCNYNANPILTDTIYTQPDWYGALYYDVKPFFTDNRQYWVLLGINYCNQLINRKIIEVLSFTPENCILFGRKWFDTGKQIKYREVFEYASNGVMSLRFISDNSIVFDHLVPISPSLIDEHQYYGSDYSYDGYNFQNGLWSLEINVDARNRE
jgi:hypothetical protein